MKVGQLPPHIRKTKVALKVWGPDLEIAIGVEMVKDVRANISANFKGCSVCYMIAGEESTTHVSGDSCPKMPLGLDTPGRPNFKKELTYTSGIVCYNCLLPTVRALLIWLGCR